MLPQTTQTGFGSWSIRFRFRSGQPAHKGRGKEANARQGRVKPGKLSRLHTQRWNLEPGLECMPATKPEAAASTPATPQPQPPKPAGVAPRQGLPAAQAPHPWSPSPSGRSPLGDRTWQPAGGACDGVCSVRTGLVLLEGAHTQAVGLHGRVVLQESAVPDSIATPPHWPRQAHATRTRARSARLQGMKKRTAPTHHVPRRREQVVRQAVEVNRGRGVHHIPGHLLLTRSLRPLRATCMVKASCSGCVMRRAPVRCTTLQSSGTTTALTPIAAPEQPTVTLLSQGTAAAAGPAECSSASTTSHHRLRAPRAARRARRWARRPAQATRAPGDQAPQPRARRGGTRSARRAAAPRACRPRAG